MFLRKISRKDEKGQKEKYKLKDAFTRAFWFFLFFLVFINLGHRTVQVAIYKVKKVYFIVYQKKKKVYFILVVGDVYIFHSLLIVDSGDHFDTILSV